MDPIRSFASHPVPSLAATVPSQDAASVFSSPTNIMWMTLLAMAAIWGLVAIVRIIVDGVVQTRQHRADLERDVLNRVLQDLDEVKERLDVLRQERTPR